MMIYSLVHFNQARSAKRCALGRRKGFQQADIKSGSHSRNQQSATRYCFATPHVTVRRSIGTWQSQSITLPV
jgi:hypothetical protein